MDPRGTSLVRGRRLYCRLRRNPAHIRGLVRFRRRYRVLFGRVQRRIRFRHTCIRRYGEHRRDERDGHPFIGGLYHKGMVRERRSGHMFGHVHNRRRRTEIQRKRDRSRIFRRDRPCIGGDRDRDPCRNNALQEAYLLSLDGRGTRSPPRLCATTPPIRFRCNLRPTVYRIPEESARWPSKQSWMKLVLFTTFFYWIGINLLLLGRKTCFHPRPAQNPPEQEKRTGTIFP